MEARIIQFVSAVLVLQFCTCKDTITLNQTLQEGDQLVSEQNNFVLGFFSPDHSKYKYLGIWFSKVSIQTVVWVANRNNPISGSSASGILSVNRQGNLALYSTQGNIQYWSTDVSEKDRDQTWAVEAQLLDTGNLVLVQAISRTILWQSFDHPTHTLLQGMVLGLNRLSGINLFLTSWRSANDPGIGDYSYKLNPSGSPQFYIYNGTKRIWRTSPWPWKTCTFCPLVFNFVQNEYEMYNFLVHDPSIIARVMLDDLGAIRFLIWHEKDIQWKEFWATPRDRCDLYGKCGANSKCDSDIGNKFECNCLPGYEPKSLRNWHLRDGSDGCIRKRLNSSSVCGHGAGFVKVENVKVPDSSTAVRVDMRSSHIECERKCRNDCSCSAYSNMNYSGNGNGCLSWYGDLFDTKNYMGLIGFDLYVRVDALELELAESSRGSSSMFEQKGMLLVIILSASSAWFILIIIILIWFCLKSKKKRTKKSRKNKRLLETLVMENELEEGSRSHRDLVLLDINTILDATDNFSPSNKIGQGGFGTVYKGKLANEKEIAVKRKSRSSRQGMEEFKNEAILIAKLQHRNLVKLVGFCIQQKEQILVYEYMPNKDETRKSQLDWEKRFNIIDGIARGILYLHQDSRLRIIHRDLKTSNILLDAEMNSKISDFGMAKIFQNDQVQGKTNRIVGTFGYMSPEYATFGIFSVKSDVFSFGVILLEIISGKKNSGFSQQDPSLSLIEQVWELWNEDRALEIVDTLLKESYDPQVALRCIQIGLLCVEENAKERPSMLEVVFMLKSETALPSPKQPAFIFRSTSSNSSLPGEEARPYSINDMTNSIVLTR
ncbi:G-type lectin S-receptor-like serine/threonine-protein kinase At1g11410 isoform X2 [Mercurialis annua]|uniref:G-type lectin S-receptor-like serine/threonine-protein kinase At1g11410 isoform X2 n=1 Tax=Mercurialis annua TaxID=3986 RepID=UPI002160482B|nr:G-type lectin S-receptor-like serine/threonine-protein kinase At1g11410 isoform X2 [Mercurialis annua]